MTNHKLLRILITTSVSMLYLFFKIKDAKVDRVYRRRLSGDQVVTKPAGSSDRPAPRSASHPFVGIPISDSTLIHSQEAQTSCEDVEYVEYSAQSRLPKLDGPIKFYYQFTHLVLWYLLLKNIFISLIRSDVFSSWRYLDCFLPGRFIVNGRVIEVAPFCACYLILIRMLWRYAAMKKTPEFRVPCIEFLLARQEQHEPYWLRELTAKTRGGPGKLDHEFHSTLLEFYNPFARANGVRPFKLRPNRTREAWNQLARVALRYYALFAVIYSIIMCTFLRMGVPVILTQRGFAYSYRHCIQWIMANTRRGQLSESSELVNGSSTGWTNRVYDSFVDGHTETTEPLWLYLMAPSWVDAYTRPMIIQDIFMPFTNLVELNLFHIVRFATEFSESFFVYSEAAMYFNGSCFMTVMMSRDIVLYCQSINRRLTKLIASLRHVTSGSSISAFEMRRSQYYDMIYLGRNTGRYGQALEREVMLHEMKFASLKADLSEIQAMISDLFLTIDAYNEYISLQALILIIAWLGYSAMVSSWIFIPGNESPKLEWYVIHVCATSYVFLMLSYLTGVKTSCRRLYNLITVAMALDENFRSSKSVWVSLLKFYSPRSLYCFTVIGSIELTHMLGLKLLVWLVSALIVASSFFHVYNIK